MQIERNKDRFLCKYFIATSPKDRGPLTAYKYVGNFS